MIEAAIETCSAFVLVLTPEAYASKWVRRELARATRLNKPIRPLLLRASSIPIEIEGVEFEDVTSGELPNPRFVARLRSLTSTAAMSVSTSKYFNETTTDPSYSWPTARVVAATADDPTVRVWDAATGQAIATLGDCSGAVRVAWSPDGARVVTGSNDNTARVWRVAR